MKTTYIEGVYVTPCGRVFVEEQSGIRSDGRKWRVPAGFRKLTKNKDGYLQVRINGKLEYVHRLMCYAFHGEGEDMIVNHKDCNKSNNAPDNLEWVTYSENNKHAHDNVERKITTGALGRKCKLTAEQVSIILDNCKSDDPKTQKQLADEFGVTQPAISAVVTGKNWGDYEDRSV